MWIVFEYKERCALAVCPTVAQPVSMGKKIHRKNKSTPTPYGFSSLATGLKGKLMPEVEVVNKHTA